MSDIDSAPQVRVVRGAPDDLELAALVAGLLASTSGPLPDPDPAAPGGWADRSRLLRGFGPARRGADSWRWSLHP
ncbi:MAG: acyl-CoA carboxylase subunit epsilon [Actinobacteria bacterium]|nr:acyl-CoA carboxylase subunit epsilon [Actinomycetota bacterium]MCG2802096.1 acyl-CoA carboxylase subunit epsilon [Cellulomonas sp.]